jgi:hypothetical protein
MPGTTSTQITSAFSRVQKQARELLVGVRREIRFKEADLRRLKKEESQLSAITSQRGNKEAKSASGGSAGATARINWGTVLEQLPKQFKASHIRTVRGLKKKRSSEIFAAITRWMEAGAVKRKERGRYERMQQSQERRRKKPTLHAWFAGDN